MNKKLMSTIKAKAPIGLLILGCAGVGLTAISAIFDKDRYDNLIEEVKAEKEEKQEEMKRTDVVKVVVRSYWRTIAVGVFSICCIIASNRITAGQLATVGAAYAASENKRKEFMEKATEVVGEKKVTEIKNKIDEDKMISAVNMQTIPGDGPQLFYETWTGRVWKDTKTNVEAGVNSANAELLNSDMLSVNDWCEHISHGKLGETKGGEDSGWTTEFCTLIHVSWYAKAITEGPYAGYTAWAIQFHTNDEPRTNIRY